MKTPHKNTIGVRRLVCAAGACAILAGCCAGLALASGATVSAAHNSKLRASILESGGRTLYALSPETSHHLLCTSSACLSAWPPLEVSHSTHLSLGGGAHGSLGLVRRGSKWQVTINGLPLYFFVGDSRHGEASGEGIHNFGGTWHTLLASGHPR